MFLTIIHLLSYLCLRAFGGILSLLPYAFIQRVGKKIGTLVYYLHRSFRKKALSNVAIAYGEALSEKERKSIALESFQNLVIACLELFRLKRSRKNLSEIIQIEGEEALLPFIEKKQGMIFLTCHQANWEIPFLAITAKYRGIGIGRPIKNRWLYRWLLSIREMNGGKIVMPRNAIRESLKALKEGKFVGIVGDQAFPESPYAYPLFGTRAWTTNTPALLAYRTGCPLIAVSTKRVGHRYVVRGSPPLWPDLALTREEALADLMNRAMHYLEKSIQEAPGQWMWQHDRWKQQGIDHVKRPYRYGFILVIIPPDFSPYLPLFPLLKAIYPRSFLTFCIPEGCPFSLEGCEKRTYRSLSELYIRDFRYQFLIDLSNTRSLRKHFLSLGVKSAVHLKKMQRRTRESDLQKAILHTLVKKECLSTVTI